MENKTDYDYINPSHYKKGDKEVWEMMVAIWGVDAYISYCTITAMKYRMRIGSKPNEPAERDLEKIKWYENKAKELRLQEAKRQAEQLISQPKDSEAIQKAFSDSHPFPKYGAETIVPIYTDKELKEKKEYRINYELRKADVEEQRMESAGVYPERIPSTCCLAFYAILRDDKKYYCSNCLHQCK